MTAPRVSVNDLLGAADWLRAYEGPDGVIGDNGPGGDDRAVELLRVAEWLDAEIARRNTAQMERAVARKAGVDLNDPASRRQVRDVVRRQTTGATA